MGKYEKKTAKKKATKKTGWFGVAILAILVVIAAVVSMGYLADKREPADLANPTSQTEIQEPSEAVHIPEPSETVQTPEPSETEEPYMKVLTLDKIERQEERMIVYTSYGTMAFPYSFSDLIHITPVNNGQVATLHFYTLLNEVEYPIFSIAFNSSEGIPLGTMMLDDTMPQAPVSAAIHEADASLDEGSLLSFYASQEIMNDIITSLAENEGFTPVE